LVQSEVLKLEIGHFHENNHQFVKVTESLDLTVTVDQWNLSNRLLKVDLITFVHLKLGDDIRDNGTIFHAVVVVNNMSISKGIYDIHVCTEYFFSV
jgi:hypothetical protein